MHAERDYVAPLSPGLKGPRGVFPHRACAWRGATPAPPRTRAHAVQLPQQRPGRLAHCFLGGSHTRRVSDAAIGCAVTTFAATEAQAGPAPGCLPTAVDLGADREVARVSVTASEGSTEKQTHSFAPSGCDSSRSNGSISCGGAAALTWQGPLFTVEFPSPSDPSPSRRHRGGTEAAESLLPL